MLNGIPSVIDGDLLKILSDMGHGDELVIADGNFPAGDIAKRLLKIPGHGVPITLTGVLQLFPLDSYVSCPVVLMEKPKADKCEPSIWQEYRKILSNFGDIRIEHLERYSFYERAKNAYAVVLTGEGALCANIIIKKGVVLK